MFFFLLIIMESAGYLHFILHIDKMKRYASSLSEFNIRKALFNYAQLEWGRGEQTR